MTPAPAAKSAAAPVTADTVRAEARALGFDAVGLARPDAVPGLLAEAGAALDRFLAQGHHGGMAWMAERADQRRHPQALWPEMRTAVMVGLNYGPAVDPMILRDHPTKGAVSVYARGKDYHDVLKKRLKRLARWLHERSGQPVKVFVDTAPVMEKPLAEAAGIGWRGKHTNLVSRDLGNWLFLGALFTPLALDADAPERDHCGSCQRCLDACPTDAFPAPYQLDARRCISYLTIEHKGPIPHALRPALGNRIYGCDDCLAVCPWNKFALRSAEAQFFARAELGAPDLADLALLDDGGFRTLFSGSPIKRTGRARFVRNVLIAIGNSGDAGLVGLVEGLLDDAEPVVRGAAVWAVAQLAPADRVRAFKARRADRETDPDVIAEWAHLPD
ncbi:tRNA epoxyqueuosine(34) reductase QueG [Rhodothalassium salexigens]|uniref:tRNA epoxyqueuosine(34) reductase QueG n=1 Tax=Rhodothalassium salexigens TaxID=1086 RepID=UPI001912249E|nr:tRNA epoxyqueuosine(34) reductase QueG [Rhodothalassium salexigens]MBK5911202.1 tRNA epoxyqueuosine(34) reductase QueG [Rhodothalassium salexigens]MBK5919890.1 tRNA epoxyqueuosine(34) reductase QueG [Rhodothalassium salexigens]